MRIFLEKLKESIFSVLPIVALRMIQSLGLVGGLAGQIDAQLAQHIHIRLSQDHAGVYLGALQMLQLFNGTLCLFVGDSTDGEGDQELVRVETGILVAQVGYLQVLDRAEDFGRDQLDLVVDACQFFQRV